MTIGERIRYVRNSKNITQSALADSIHISPSFMNRIESGSSMPSIDTVCAIADALHSSPQELLCDIFVYPDDTSVSERIKNIVEQLPAEKQQLVLETLEFLLPRLI
ncbi:XRE family transcriptional regulator [Clostridium sp. AF19-22AC]|jgi:transcriptional regulator with XRE-family HTH domain|uniref:Transcriptional regulator with XRE-family HTH domain n=1 Tax=Faecalicatena orotica TaxID=1544 RepID=A0A2Y9BD45_9FIRM|nr:MULTISPECIES: helix-turn-helix transcriptional regulator [Clostridia]PWJ29732.1 transcriptional regulator with XRE-family HTH domain [Faecalicatena orotica]RHR21899.1 XRE family transcriptional regulator [Clostridium sp. AF19-22AC]SSA55456.1 Transcriptional regulator, contains XRE-family HTH domain [Faecalicatena orotica]